MITLYPLLEISGGAVLLIGLYWLSINWSWLYLGTVTFSKHSVVYVQQVHDELYKCTWPWDPNLEATNIRKYRELIQLTGLVIISVVLLAGLVSVADLLIHPAIGFLTNTGLK